MQVEAQSVPGTKQRVSEDMRYFGWNAIYSSSSWADLSESGAVM